MECESMMKSFRCTDTEKLFHGERVRHELDEKCRSSLQREDTRFWVSLPIVQSATEH